MMIEAVWAGLAILADPFHMGMLLLGVAIGLLLGVLPGIGGLVGFALMLPFVYGLGVAGAIAVLIGMVAVTVTGDTVTSILLAIPGGAGSVATVIDGHPMARKGEASRALSAAFVGSAIGGVLGAVILAASMPIALPLIRHLGSPEFFMFCMLGISMVSVLSGSSPLKGLISAGIGLMLGSVGLAPGSAVARFDLGILYLYQGIPIILVALGFFGVAECIDLMMSGTPIAEAMSLGKGTLMGIKDVFREMPLVLRATAIGTYIGFVPGLGTGVASWLAYGHAVQSAKDKSGFGHGDVRGVIAPETANNAERGGALIPTLAFGVPGSTTMALFMMALLMFGIYPGPDMMTKHMDLVWVIIWSLAIANVLGALVCLLLTKPLARISLIPIHILAPFVLMILILGAFQATQHWGDLIVLLLLGIVGWTMKQLGFPRPPLVVAFVLGPISESYLFLSMQRWGAAFLLRPWVVGIGLVALASLIMGIRWQMRKK